jgi:competence protein ComEC
MLLSVSGMHVAMIYSILLLFFGAPGDGCFVEKNFKIHLLCIRYPVVCRAHRACPAVVAGRSDDPAFPVWQSNGLEYADLEFVGICSICDALDEVRNVYYNVGFQLSFLAIAGILLFAKPIIRSLSFKSKILHWTWEIVALSIAAQVFIVSNPVTAVSPVSAHLYHQ